MACEADSQIPTTLTVVNFSPSLPASTYTLKLNNFTIETITQSNYATISIL
jgi:hypothetical protein